MPSNSFPGRRSGQSANRAQPEVNGGPIQPPLKRSPSGRALGLISGALPTFFLLLNGCNRISGYFKALSTWTTAMKVLSSLKSAKQRHRDCKIVRRRGKVFVICKSNPRFKARQR